MTLRAPRWCVGGKRDLKPAGRAQRESGLHDSMSWECPAGRMWRRGERLRGLDRRQDGLFLSLPLKKKSCSNQRTGGVDDLKRQKASLCLVCICIPSPHMHILHPNSLHHPSDLPTPYCSLQAGRIWTVGFHIPADSRRGGGHFCLHSLYYYKVAILCKKNVYFLHSWYCCLIFSKVLRLNKTNNSKQSNAALKTAKYIR